jgi:hypothetical protein
LIDALDLCSPTHRALPYPGSSTPPHGSKHPEVYTLASPGHGGTGEVSTPENITNGANCTSARGTTGGSDAKPMRGSTLVPDKTLPGEPMLRLATLCLCWQEPGRSDFAEMSHTLTKHTAFVSCGGNLRVMGEGA